MDIEQQKIITTERWILFSTILATSMAFIDGSALNVALPAIQTSLNTSGADLLWIVNSYLLMLAALILVGGSLGDRLGRKKIFMSGITLFVLASIASGLSPSVEWMIVARIIQGIGGALMIPGSLSIITALIDPSRRGKAIGTWSAVTTIVFVVGPVLGGILADHGFWRGVFFINVPLGILALIVLYLKVPENRDESMAGPIDFYGAGLVTVGLAGLTYGFISAPNMGFDSPLVYGSLLIGVVALIVFVVVEYRKASPMLPLNLFKSPTFSGTNLLTLFLYGALSVMTFFNALNMIQVQGYSKTDAGLAALPFVLLLTVMSPWAGGLADRFGPRRFLIVGPTLVGCGFIWFAFIGLTAGPGSYWTTFLPGIILVGAGMGFTVAPLTSTVMGSVPRHLSGTASGVNNAVSRTASVLAIAIIGSIALILFSQLLQSNTVDLSLSHQARISLQVEAQKLGGAEVPPGVSSTNAAAVAMAIKQSFADTYKVLMLICAGLAWISAFMAALLVEKRPTPQPEHVQQPGQDEYLL